MKSYYDMICECVPDFRQFEFKEFCETMALINSRGFDMPIKGERSFALVPYADMINHSFEKPNLFRFDEESGGFILYAAYDIAYGEEIFIDYGQSFPTSNFDLFLGYGFVCQEPGADEV
jgi:hypothetical protein